MLRIRCVCWFVNAAVVDYDWGLRRSRSPCFLIWQEKLETKLLLVVTPKVLDLRNILIWKLLLNLDPVLAMDSYLLLKDGLLLFTPNRKVSSKGLSNRWLLLLCDEDL